MGRKVNWFRAVKKALSSECREHKDKRSSKSKKKWFVKKKKSLDSISVSATTIANITTSTSTDTTSVPLPPVAEVVSVEAAVNQIPIIPSENDKLKEEEDEQKKHAQSIAIATAKAAEAAAAAAQAAAEVVRLTSAAPFPAKLKEDAAALRIQTAFRRYLARRALCALRGLASLKIVMQGEPIKRKTTDTFKSMQSLARVQSQVRAIRLRLSADNQPQKGQILEKKVKKHEKVESLQQNESGWDGSPKSKKQMEARLQSQHEATMRRERAMAYSLNHQQTWRDSPTSKRTQTVFNMESKNQHSGWSWLERWLAARPWESASEPDHSLVRTSIHASSGSEVAKAILHHVSEKRKSEEEEEAEKERSTPKAVQRRRRTTSTGRFSTSTPCKARISSRKTKINSRTKTSPKTNPRRSICYPDDDVDDNDDDDDEDGKSMVSAQSSVDNNDDMLSTSPAGLSVPSYMAPTESARAKSRLGNSLTTDNKQETMDRLSVCSAKKRASSPARSRNSVSSITDVNSIAEHQNLINAM